MTQYISRNITKSQYHQRHGDDPYRSQAGIHYRRLLDRYKQPRSAGGSGGHRSSSKYRPNVVRYHSGSGYKSKAKEGTRSQVIVRREPSPHIEFPEYKPRPDIEVLLKELEKRFDERLHERVLEMMETESVEARAEVLHRYDLPDTATDEDLREKIDRLTDLEKWKQHKGHFIEHPPDVPENGPDTLKGSEKNTPENTVEADPEQLGVPSQRALLETMEEAAPQIQESVNISEVELPSVSELAHAEVETPPPEHTSESIVASSDQAAEPIEATMLEDRLLIADIEALYNELETEQQESEEEVEPSY
jgi:hypothetical protein